MNQLLLRSDDTGTLPDRIYTRVIEAILRGDFGPAGKLPTEGDLARTFGVSRPTVREALSRLRSDGIIDSKRGSGSYVLRSPGMPAPSATPIKNMGDIERYYAFRICVETGAAALAAEFRDASDLESLRGAFDALNAAMEGGNSDVEEEVRFHLAIASASHNPFFVASISTSVAPIRQFIELARTDTNKKSLERMRASQAEHLAIVDAIERRASMDASEAIRVHILNAKRRLFEGMPLP